MQTRFSNETQRRILIVIIELYRATHLLRALYKEIVNIYFTNLLIFRTFTCGFIYNATKFCVAHSKNLRLRYSQYV